MVKTIERQKAVNCPEPPMVISQAPGFGKQEATPSPPQAPLLIPQQISGLGQSALIGDRTTGDINNNSNQHEHLFRKSEQKGDHELLNKLCHSRELPANANYTTGRTANHEFITISLDQQPEKASKPIKNQSIGETPKCSTFQQATAAAATANWVVQSKQASLINSNNGSSSSLQLISGENADFSGPRNNMNKQIKHPNIDTKETKNSLESINSKQSDTSALVSDQSVASLVLENMHQYPPQNTLNANGMQTKNNLQNEDVLNPNDLEKASHKMPDRVSIQRSMEEKPKMNFNAEYFPYENHNDDKHQRVNKEPNGPLGPADMRRPSKAVLRRECMTQKPPFPFAGICAAMLSSVFFSVSALMIKLLPDSDEGEGIQEKMKALMIRGLLISLMSGLTICATNSTFKVKRDEIWVNFCRALFGSLGVMSFFCSLEYISLGDATALIFSSPIWTYILSNIIFAEPLHWILIILLPFGLVGMILISHPTLIIPATMLTLNTQVDTAAISYLDHAAALSSAVSASVTSLPEFVSNNNNSVQVIISSLLSNSSQIVTTTPTNYIEPHEIPSLDSASAPTDNLGERWPGIVISLMGSLLVSLNYIVLKFRKSTPIQTTSFWFGVGQMICSGIVMCFIGFGQVPKTLTEWGLLLANGFLSWLAQCVLQWSFAYEDAGVLSIIRTGDVAFSFIFSALFLDDTIYWTSIVGSIILGLVVMLIIVNNWIQKSCHSNNDAHLIYAHDHVSTITPTKLNPLPSPRQQQAAGDKVLKQ